MRFVFLLSAFLVLASCKSDPTEPQAADLPHVMINNMAWTNANLEVATFRNGDTILHARDTASWNAAGREMKPAWCYADDADSNGLIYGKLYNWYAVSDPRGLAPTGWHVPSQAEWEQMLNSLGDNPGTQLKNKTGWNGWASGGNGTNTTGFSGLPGGYRGRKGKFYTIGIYGSFWTSTKVDTMGIGEMMYCNDSLVYTQDHELDHGLSVRLVRDK